MVPLVAPSIVPSSAIFPASIAVASSTVNLPAVQNSVDGSLAGFPMYAVSNDENLSFKNLCGALKLSLQKNGVSVSRIDVTTNAAVNGQFSIVMNGDAPTINLVSNGSNTASLVCATAQDISNGHDFYMYLPHNTYTSLTITITAQDGSVCTKNTNDNFIGLNIYRSQVSQISLGENSLNFVPAEPSDVPAGAVNGLFSISASKQIYFAKGNLQYVGTTGTWQFAEHQYDYLGTSNANPNANSTIDLFGWGTSGYNHRDNYWQPYSTKNNSDNYRAYGSLYYDLNQAGQNGKADWGYNAISNGGNTENSGWRTMTSDEWSYLLTNHTRGWASVNGVSGLVIRPYGVSTAVAASYDAEAWAVEEAAGAVFLPAAGVRVGDTDAENKSYVRSVGTYAFYWTATHYDNSGNHNAYRTDINSSGVTVTYNANPACGNAVRLVKDVN